MSAVRTHNTYPLIHTVENSNRGWQNTLQVYLQEYNIFIKWFELLCAHIWRLYTLFIPCAGWCQLFQVVSRPAVKEQIWGNDNATVYFLGMVNKSSLKNIDYFLFLVMPVIVGLSLRKRKWVLLFSVACN